MLATEHSEGVSITAGMTTGCPSLKATPSDASIFQEIGFIDFPSILDNRPIVQLSLGNGVASSDVVTRCITGSAASPPRYAQVRGRYCRLLSGHPSGEAFLVIKTHDFAGDPIFHKQV